jgi:DNA-binding MarR family transcriptional regulator
MSPDASRDLHLLNEVTQTPDATQRDLSRRIGIALGLTNLMLRRLATKGYIKIVNVQKSRLRYLITPQGLLEKARLTGEYIEYSLVLYRQVRRALRERLLAMRQAGERRVLLWGTGELAEIAYLTIQELGLELVGVVEDPPGREQFLGHPVRSMAAAISGAYDRLIVASLGAIDAVPRLLEAGVERDRLIVLPIPGVRLPLPERDEASGAPVAMTG